MILPAIIPALASCLFANNGDWNDPAAAPIMIVVGALGLWKAQRIYAVARRLQQVPVTPIASTNVGTVRLRGKVHCDAPIISPFSKTPCCYCRAEVEHEHSGEANVANWNPVHQESSKTDFIISDASGEVRVHPQGLEFEGELNYQHDVIANPRDEHEQALLDYVTQNCPDPANAWVLKTAKKAFLGPEQQTDPHVQERLRVLEERHAKRLHRKTKGHSYRFREFYLLPGQECEIAGTLEFSGGQWLLGKGSNGAPFFLNTKGDRDLPHGQKQKAFAFAVVGGLLAVLGVFFVIFNR